MVKGDLAEINRIIKNGHAGKLFLLCDQDKRQKKVQRDKVKNRALGSNYFSWKPRKWEGLKQWTDSNVLPYVNPDTIKVTKCLSQIWEEKQIFPFQAISMPIPPTGFWFSPFNKNALDSFFICGIQRPLTLCSFYSPNGNQQLWVASNSSLGRIILWILSQKLQVPRFSRELGSLCPGKITQVTVLSMFSKMFFLITRITYIYIYASKHFHCFIYPCPYWLFHQRR